MTRKRLLSGIQPSGDPHIGNYFGAMKQFVDFQDEYESFIMIADYHALTTVRDPKLLQKNILNTAIDHLAIGLDPVRITFFRQSDVPEHLELAWIFECLVTVPFLERAHAYKDKVAKGLEPNAGLFNYPMLMAADILMYDPAIVPVGGDQRQHVEYAREAAMKFNNAFGDTFVEPQEKIVESVSVVPGTDGQKMSKSYGNTIPLFGTTDEITKGVMSIVTDSSGDFPEHVYAIHKLFKTESELKPLYEEHAGQYKALKEALLGDIEAFIAPLREKRNLIAADPGAVLHILKNGGGVAQETARTKMQTVRERIGLILEA